MVASSTDALNSLVRRAALAELARAAADYQPTSYDDAIALRTLVVGVIEAELADAGEVGDDASYSALVDLRTTVVRDLAARGANLAPLKTVSAPTPMPALTLAMRLYGDASRADELLQRAAPRHPLFMPTTFRAPAV